MEKYRAIAFSPDGDYITEGNFKTVDEAWSHISDWGSRWYFYPLTGVATEKTVVSACDLIPTGRIATVSRFIKANGEELCTLLSG